jgi:hypothetical protein
MQFTPTIQTEIQRYFPKWGTLQKALKEGDVIKVKEIIDTIEQKRYTSNAIVQTYNPKLKEEIVILLTESLSQSKTLKDTAEAIYETIITNNQLFTSALDNFNAIGLQNKINKEIEEWTNKTHKLYDRNKI